MNCVDYTSPSSVSNHAELKQHQACFEPPPPPDLVLGRSGAGLNSSNLHVGSTSAVHPYLAHSKPQPPLRIGKYLLLHQLEGSTLYKSVNIETQEELVCKVVNKNDSHKTFSAHFRLEGHEHINEVAEVLIGEEKTYIFFSRSHGDLYSHVRTRRRLRESEAQALFKQVAEVVAYCHENKVVLRDLKLRKFVYTDPERTHLKLESLEDAVVLDDDDDDSLTDRHGCPAYVSPEILTASASYSGYAADCWSMGVMLYTMLLGRYPFHDTEPSLLFAKIKRGHLVVPEWLSSRARCLIRGLLRPNPSERLTAADVLAHPWLQAELPESSTKNSDQTVPSAARTPLCESSTFQSLK